MNGIIKVAALAALLVSGAAFGVSGTTPAPGGAGLNGFSEP